MQIGSRKHTFPILISTTALNALTPLSAASRTTNSTFTNLVSFLFRRQEAAATTCGQMKRKRVDKPSAWSWQCDRRISSEWLKLEKIIFAANVNLFIFFHTFIIRKFPLRRLFVLIILTFEKNLRTLNGNWTWVNWNNKSGQLICLYFRILIIF